MSSSASGQDQELFSEDDLLENADFVPTNIEMADLLTGVRTLLTRTMEELFAGVHKELAGIREDVAALTKQVTTGSGSAPAAKGDPLLVSALTQYCHSKASLARLSKLKVKVIYLFNVGDDLINCNSCLYAQMDCEDSAHAVFEDTYPKWKSWHNAVQRVADSMSFLDMMQDESWGTHITEPKNDNETPKYSDALLQAVAYLQWVCDCFVMS
jgi:hypothetical protein